MIRLVAVGKLKDHNLGSSFNEYKIRLERFTKFEVLELKDKKQLHKHVPDEKIIVVLDEKGKTLSSHELSNFIKENYLSKDIVFIVGGPDGIAEDILKKADLRLSLSKMTFTSQMARLLLIEQLYRAFTIMHGIGYHK